MINVSKLRSLVYEDPIRRNSKGLDLYEEPIADHDYIVTVDVVRVGIDYSAFVIFDITTFPHKVVGKFKNNEIKPMLFPSVIYDVAKL